MSKSLKNILNGIKSSKIVPGSTGDDPGVDYAPKVGDEQKFVALHKTEKHADRAGNDSDVQSGAKVKFSLSDMKNARLGKKMKQSEKDDFAPIKEGVQSTGINKDESIRYHTGRHERAVASLMRDPKNRVSNGSTDIEFHARTALKKLGVNVKKPNHPAVIEEVEPIDGKNI